MHILTKMNLQTLQLRIKLCLPPLQVSFKLLIMLLQCYTNTKSAVTYQSLQSLVITLYDHNHCQYLQGNITVAVFKGVWKLCSPD